MRIKQISLLIGFILVCAATAAAQSIESVYTEVGGNKCRTLERDDEAAGYLLEQCPGVAGYKLQVVSGDDRQTITVVKPDGSKHELNLGQIGGGGFSGLGAKAEWRVRRQGGKLVPVALIVRLDVNVGGAERATSYLTVSKITPQRICLVEAIDPGPDQNEKARRLADASAARPCYGATPSDN